MKKIPFLILGIALVLVVIAAIWYFLPAAFLRGVAPSDITSISVFDGSTGEGFEISDPDEIRYIVENIQSAEMKKDTISIGYSGFCFRISFYDKTGKIMDSFTINSADTIRKDPFFYRCDGTLCFDYLKELEEKY